YEGVDSDYMTQLYKFIQIEISPKGQYFMVLFVYKILDGEGQDLAGRTSFFLFDMTGKNVSKYKDDLSSTGDRSYFTDDDAFFTFAFIQPSIDYDMERPYKGMRILTIPGLQVIKTYLYDNHSLWWQAPPRAQGKYILIGLNNYKTNQWGFDIINPYAQTKSRKVYTKAEYTYPTTTSKGIRVKVSEGTTRVDSFKNFDYQGF
ncbi:MAG: hypothetical protein K9N34_10575, partial [Candidatus Marinimicrobia bacterium]|nr:hypothetical protein [Candidatus Neomarinimicrobiota bacterium]